MRVVSIEFDDAEDLGFVTARLSAAEAAFIATFTGKQTGETAEAIMPGGAEASSHLYSGFTGGVFNRLYESGVSEWVEDQRPS
jgi:hypothetical protein